MKDLIKATDSEEIKGCLDAAKIQIFGTVSQKVDLMTKRRDACDKRGYHRVEREPVKGKISICYDCELWFDSDLLVVPYKVIPLW